MQKAQALANACPAGQFGSQDYALSGISLLSGNNLAPSAVVFS
eukprot:gene4091-4426_t